MSVEVQAMVEDEMGDGIAHITEMETAAAEAEPGMRVEAHWKNLVDSESDSESDFGSSNVKAEDMDTSEKPIKTDFQAHDSDSQALVERTRDLPEKVNSGTDSDDEPVTKKKVVAKRISKRIDSSSDDDNETSNIPLTGGTLKIQLERINHEHEPSVSGTQKSGSSPKRWENLVDSDDEEDLLPLPEYYEQSSSRPIVKNSDSDDSSVGVHKRGSDKFKSKPLKDKKLTQKQRDELRKELTSKTQKMVREAPVSLPYHKPKPQTLKEFLQRRNKTKAEFYTTLSESKTLNLKKLGLPSETLVKDWMSAAVDEPAKLSPEEKNEFTLEDFNLMDDDDFNVVNTKQDSVKKKLFDEPEVEFELDADVHSVRDLMQDMLEKIEQTTDKPKPLSPVRIVIKTEKPDDGYDATFETDSELEEEFELVDLAADDERPVPITKDVVPSSSATDSDSVTVNEMEVNVIPGQNDMENVQEDEKEASVIATPAETSAIDDFQAKEDELNSYLNATAKPKKPTLREMLMQSSAYQKVANLKPSIKSDEGSRTGFIDLTSPSKKQKKAASGIQQLMDRYVKHTMVYKKPKEQHFKVHSSTKEEDSQGNQSIKVNEFDYVQRDENDDADELNNSPIRSTPVSKFSQFREKMEASIRAKKVKEYEEKRKLYAIYNDEKVLEDKEEEEEELVDEFSTESEPELTDEEMEAMRSARRKKKKKVKSAFVDEEAEDSDAPNQTGNEESEDEPEVVDLEESSMENEDEPLHEKTYRRVQKIEDSSDEDEQEVEIEDDDEDKDVPLKDLSPLKDPLIKSRKEELEAEWDTDSDDAEENTEMPTPSNVKSDFEFRKREERNLNLNIQSSQPIETPSKPTFMVTDTQITPAQREILKLVDSETPILCSQNKESPIDWKLPIQPNKSRFSGNLSTLSVSPFLPRLDSDAALEALKEDMQKSSQETPSVSKEISMLFDGSNSAKNSPNLMDLCSGKFPSQAPDTPAESQCPEFDDDDAVPEALSQTQSQTPVTTLSTKTPVRGLRNINKETPRGSEKEKVSKTRLFMNNRKVASPSVEEISTGGVILSDDEDGPDSNIVIKPNLKRKKRRLEFSDDENSDSDTKPDDSEAEPESDAEVSDKEYDSEENEVVKLKPVFKGLKSRAGGIRKEFVENEAELSGSEEGSGDEDERGLDELDIEEADAEEIDEEKLRDELGRAHLRHVLDEDQRDVRYFQDALLEDGDLHLDGAARERQFKWKNIDSLMLDVNGRVIEDNKMEVEDEAERLRLEEKAEKIKWMKENSQLLGEEEEEEEIDSQKLFLENSQYFRLGKSTLKKIQSSCSFMEASSSNSGSQFTKITSSVTWEKSTSSSSKDANSQGANTSGANLTSKSFFASPDDPLLKMKRGSFLSRGATTLTKLAEMTKGSDVTSNVKTNSRNFVFAVVTPPAPDGSNGKDGDETHSKASKKPSARQRNQKNIQPKKMPRIDRSFDSMDSTSKAASIFKHY